MKTGRNEPCPCGSGLKYKKCCLLASASLAVNELTPVQQVEARARAFAEGDFAFIYDSYHCDAPFRRHFPMRDEYLSYARSDLQGRYRIHSCKILCDDMPLEGEARVLFFLDLEYGGEGHQSLELARFLKTADGWRYHSGQKVNREQFTGPLEEVTMAEVEECAEGISF
ncbi:MAG: SEC-C domain-containing protein [Desulfuromonadaceae bacterium]|nr:SEC-C domain-containing protein [Desulfuromonadaceae bacterium]